MNTTSEKIIYSVLTPMLAGMVASCQKIDLGDYSNASNDDTYNVKITSKSGGGTEVPLPLVVYAVNDDGLIENKANIAEGSSSANMSLRSGNFTFYAVAGAAASESDVPSSNEVTAENGFFTQPVMQGEEQTKVDDDAELTVSMVYAVAAVDVTMENVPTNVTAVSVKLATLRNTMTIEGDYDGSTTATLELTKQSDGTTWKSDVAYVFPSVSAPTTLTFTQTFDDNTTQSYVATYNAKLTAGTPYHFNGAGTNVGSNDLSINVTVGDWDDAIYETLTLSPVGSGDGNGSMSSDGETYLVTTMPTEADAGTVLDEKFILLYVEGNKGLFLSKKEWSNLKPNITEINATINGYTENDVTGWVIPSSEQITKIRDTFETYKKFYDIVNPKLISNAVNGDALRFAQGVYYLCENAEKKYSLYNYNSLAGLSTSDETASNFYLRLVKQVTFQIKQ